MKDTFLANRMKKTILFLFILISIAAHSQQQNYIVVDRNGTGNFSRLLIR